MFDWLLRKKRSEPSRSVTPSTPAAPPAKSSTLAAPVVDRAAWQQRLDAALGDDPALLEIAQNAPVLDLKLAAVEALSGEAALKQAERAFRSHDRKVHQRVRHKLAAVVARREARTRADAAIDAARALLVTTPIAANRLADLDRAWAVLGADLLEAEQRDAFAALRARLDAALHVQAEAQRAAQWSAVAAPALEALRQACEEGAAARTQRIEACIATVREQLGACPESAAGSELAQAMRAACDAARQQLEAATQAAVEAQRLAAKAPEPVPAAAEPPPPPEAAAETSPAAPSAEWLQGVGDALRDAEEALAEGRSAELDRLLQTIATTLAQASGVALPARLRARLQALHAERQRLKGWQRWGGAVARENLVDEAESLARATAAAGTEGGDALLPRRLDWKAHAESIRRLRARWKELDRSGAAAGQALWLRFDAALTAAHAPLAAQQAALKSAREENLAAREVLLVQLQVTADAAPAPREALHALHEFRAAWRKLGPIAHTVPAAAAATLQARVDEVARRIEAPLADARAAALRERETLVARAEALAALDERDAHAQLRPLQSEWQQHARALPLARAEEAALWARFRQACDAVVARRDAAQQARDAEAAAGIGAREALLGRLEALARDASMPPERARALAQIDREWRDLYTPLPRAVAEGLEARYRDARAAAVDAADAHARAAWQAQCDALAARLALCERREAGQGDADALDEPWRSAPAAPAPWQSVLDARWAGDTARIAAEGEDADALLLQLEESLGVVPSPAQAQARRELKLRALKDTLEGRASQPRVSDAQRNAARLAALLARRDLHADQRDRLRAIVEATRRAPRAFEV